MGRMLSIKIISVGYERGAVFVVAETFSGIEKPENVAKKTTRHLAKTPGHEI